MGRPRRFQRPGLSELKREAELKRAAKKYVEASKALERLQANVKDWDDRGNVEINDLVKHEARWINVGR